ATRQVLQESLRLLLNNGLGWSDVLATVSQGRLANAHQVVDVEQARPVAVVDVRVEVARYGDVENHQRPARPPGEDALIALARDDWLRGPCRAQDDVGTGQHLVEAIPGDRLAA